MYVLVWKHQGFLCKMFWNAPLCDVMSFRRNRPRTFGCPWTWLPSSGMWTILYMNNCILHRPQSLPAKAYNIVIASDILSRDEIFQTWFEFYKVDLKGEYAGFYLTCSKASWHFGHGLLVSSLCLCLSLTQQGEAKSSPANTRAWAVPYNSLWQIWNKSFLVCCGMGTSSIHMGHKCGEKTARSYEQSMDIEGLTLYGRSLPLSWM